VSSTRRVTLQQACMSLGGISYHTLRRWMRSEKVERVKHPRDERFYTITVEQVAVIARARSEKPAERAGWTGWISHVPRVPPPAPQRAEGYSWVRWAREHNLDTRTVGAAVKGRRDRSRWVAPTVHLVEGKLDGAGQRALWERYHTLTRFTLCQRCPHGPIASLPTEDAVDDK
jgi:hypothetical protein